MGLVNLIPLTQCYWHVAKADEWNAYRDTTVSNKQALEGLVALFKNDDSKVTEYSDKSSENYALLRIFQERILKKLVSGRWVGSGHAIPRRPDDEMYEIPEDIWSRQPYINWEDGKVSGQGLEFINVVVSEAATLLDVPDRGSQKPAGRPTVQPFILEAYEALKSEGKLDFLQPKSALFGPICEELASRYPNRAIEFNSLGDSTIRKAISKRFDADKERLRLR